MLIQILFAIFIICGVTALYVDMGIARLTQVQMQNAADTAALEGLRQRDARDPVVCPMLDDPCLEAARRSRAINLARWTFDDDFNLAGDSLRLGAGPRLDLTGGTGGDLAANQTLDVGNPSVYDPVLQANLANQPHGDLVAGNYVPAPVHTELDDYSRSDFTPAGGGYAFLVRLRRTRDASGLDSRNGVSSNDQTIPFLFGRATTMQADPSAVNGYSPRADGITVRATAIADARPALRVGTPSPPSVTPPFPGVTRQFALTASYWRDLGDDVPDTLTGALGGLVSNLVGSCGAVVGRYSDQTQPPTLVVGTAIATAATGNVPPFEVGYVPLYKTISGVDRVVGFGYVQISAGSATICPNPESAFNITRLSRHVAAQNATALVVGGFPVQGVDLTLVLDANTALRAQGGLLAPALVR